MHALLAHRFPFVSSPLRRPATGACSITEVDTLTESEREELMAFAEYLGQPLTSETLPALLHCWHVSRG